MSTRALAAATILSLTMAGCAIQRAEQAQAARGAMVGMPKENVLACMGPPASKSAEGSVEVWSYPSGDGNTSTFSTASATSQGNVFGTPRFASYNGSASGFGTSFTRHRFCTVNVVMRDGAVAAVNYNGPTGGLLTQGEQCAYAIENCMH